LGAAQGYLFLASPGDTQMICNLATNETNRAEFVQAFTTGVAALLQGSGLVGTAKIYQVVADARAEEHGLIRVIGESGEDDLDPAEVFAAIELGCWLVAHPSIL
jgi:hypothetical protein